MEIIRNPKDLPKIDNLVVTFGSFDGVHVGHQMICTQMKELAAKEQAKTMVVTFDPHPRQIVYPNAGDLKLLSTIEEKTEWIGEQGIDYFFIQEFTVEFAQMSAQEYLEKFVKDTIQPRYVVIGYDHRFGLNRAGDYRLMSWFGDQHGIQTIEISQKLVDDSKVSSTVIRNSLLENKIEQANTLLGRPYSFKGEVIHGEKMGQRLGFKTANLEISSDTKLIPLSGIYAVEVLVEEVNFGGMLYIGTKPTLSDKGLRSVEVHLFNLDQILYGKEIEIRLIKFIRADQVFADKEALIKQLHADQKDALAILDEYRRKR